MSTDPGKTCGPGTCPNRLHEILHTLQSEEQNITTKPLLWNLEFLQDFWCMFSEKGIVLFNYLLKFFFRIYRGVVSDIRAINLLVADGPGHCPSIQLVVKEACRELAPPRENPHDIKLADVLWRQVVEHSVGVYWRPVGLAEFGDKFCSVHDACP